MAKIIQVKLTKGGIGKTTITSHISHLLNLMEKNVLILTTDSQNDILKAFFSDKDLPIDIKEIKDFDNRKVWSCDLREVVLSEYSVEEVKENSIKLRQTFDDNDNKYSLDFIPTRISEFSSNFKIKLEKLIEKLKSSDLYDYVIIDSNPQPRTDIIFSQFSDEIIVPVNCDKYCLSHFENFVYDFSDKIKTVIVNKYTPNINQNFYLDCYKEVYPELVIIDNSPYFETISRTGRTLFESKLDLENRKNKKIEKAVTSYMQIVERIIGGDN